MRISDMPMDERPRERLVKFGPSVLSDSELLAVILGSGGKGQSVVSLCRKLFFKFGIKNMTRLSVGI